MTDQQDYPAIFRNALALVQHARREDPQAVAVVLHESARDPQQAAELIMALCGVVISLLGALREDHADRLLERTIMELAAAEQESDEGETGRTDAVA